MPRAGPLRRSGTHGRAPQTEIPPCLSSPPTSHPYSPVADIPKAAKAPHTSSASLQRTRTKGENFGKRFMARGANAPALFERCEVPTQVGAFAGGHFPSSPGGSPKCEMSSKKPAQFQPRGDQALCRKHFHRR